jgi:hypothetical protein
MTAADPGFQETEATAVSCDAVAWMSGVRLGPFESDQLPLVNYSQRIAMRRR